MRRAAANVTHLTFLTEASHDAKETASLSRGLHQPTRGEAWRFAVNIAELPELLTKPLTLL